MKGIYVLLFSIFAIGINSNGQNYQKTNLGIKTVINSVEVEIQFYSPTIVRVLKWPEGKTFTKSSLSVVKTPQKTVFGIKQQTDELYLKSDSMKVNLNLKSGKVTFTTLTGDKLLSEKESGVTFTDFNDAGVKTYTINQSFVLDKDESIYGLGQQQQGRMVQRNLRLRMVQGNTDDYVPFFLSVKGYGMFWDNYSPTIFEDNPESTSFKSDVGDCIDYYFMYGVNADGTIARMRDLTGQAPMFPLWTFGYWQSKERYKSQDELVGIVKKYRELSVPIDGIIQDWQYWGNNYLWNAMEFQNVDFYNPQKMVNDIHNLNAHLIISIWSSFGPQTKPYKELDKIGALYNIKTWPESGSEKWPPNPDYPSGVRVYDPFNPDARDIYWKYLNKGLFSVGIDGWWMDSTEPDHLQFKPSDMDTKTYLGSFRKVRNAFPLMTVGGVSQNQRKVSSDKRVFILTRSAFAGQQRYGANTWSGDVTASWDALKNQISAGLNFSLSAIPYWNTDIGGFFLSKFRKKLNDAEYRELYARWMEFGAFCPMMRSHGADAPREIFNFGKKGDKVYDAIEKYINLRYSLLPYIYSASWDVTAHQSSMMRALVMDFAKDKQALNINDEYMFGKSILVCPVTRSMYSKNTKEDFSMVKSRELYLPKGSDWFDFWTGEKFTGGQTVNKESPLDIMPLYVKAGSILPVGPKVQFATEKKWDNLELRVYDGANGEFTLYEDENDNYNYEKGNYSTITFTWNNAKKTLTIGELKGSFPGMIVTRNFNIVLVNKNKGNGVSTIEKFDKSVSYTGKKVSIEL
jgi:alpha-D-xyloside xylohydrolase